MPCSPSPCQGTGWMLDSQKTILQVCLFPSNIYLQIEATTPCNQSRWWSTTKPIEDMNFITEWCFKLEIGQFVSPKLSMYSNPAICEQAGHFCAYLWEHNSRDARQLRSTSVSWGSLNFDTLILRPRNSKLMFNTIICHSSSPAVWKATCRIDEGLFNVMQDLSSCEEVSLPMAYVWIRVHEWMPRSQLDLLSASTETFLLRLIELLSGRKTKTLHQSCWCNAGLELHLSSLRKRSPEDLASGPEFVGNNIVHPTAKIGKDCKIGPNVSIGIECEIGDGVRLTSSVLLHRVHVRRGLTPPTPPSFPLSYVLTSHCGRKCASWICKHMTDLAIERHL